MKAFAVASEKIYVATYENFYIVDNFRAEHIFEEAVWCGLNPTSIVVIDNNSVFMGVRGGVIKLDLVTRSLKFTNTTVGGALNPRRRMRRSCVNGRRAASSPRLSGIVLTG
jgi:hypothetical protein